MMKRHLIVHIGTHKTGSSAIQLFLNQHRQALLRQGVFTPAGNPDAVIRLQHSFMRQAFRGDPDARARAEAFREAFLASGCPVALLSDETIEIEHDTAGYFRAFAGAVGATLEFMCFVRPQPEYINSIIQQNAKQGNVTSALDKFRIVKHWRRLNYARHFDAWPGETSALRIIPFTLDVRHNSVIRVFCEKAGINHLDPDLAGGLDIRDNAGLTCDAVYFLTFLRDMLEKTGFRHADIRDFFTRYRDDLPTEVETGPPFFALDEAQILECEQHFRQGNARFAEKYLGRRSWDEVFGPSIQELRARASSKITLDRYRELQGMAEQFLRARLGA